MSAALFWHSLDYPRDKFFVVGTELSQAVVPETLHRFVIVEVRTMDSERQPDLRYSVRDALTVSLDDVRAGGRPRQVASFSDPDQAERWARARVLWDENLDAKDICAQLGMSLGDLKTLHGLAPFPRR